MQAWLTSDDSPAVFREHPVAIGIAHFIADSVIAKHENRFLLEIREFGFFENIVLRRELGGEIDAGLLLQLGPVSFHILPLEPHDLTRFDVMETGPPQFVPAREDRIVFIAIADQLIGSAHFRIASQSDLKKRSVGKHLLRSLFHDELEVSLALRTVARGMMRETPHEKCQNRSVFPFYVRIQNGECGLDLVKRKKNPGSLDRIKACDVLGRGVIGSEPYHFLCEFLGVGTVLAQALHHLRNLACHKFFVSCDLERVGEAGVILIDPGAGRFEHEQLA